MELNLTMEYADWSNARLVMLFTSENYTRTILISVIKCETWVDEYESPTGIKPMTSRTRGAYPLSYGNSWNGCSPWVLVAKWIDRQRGVQKSMGSIPVGDSDFFLCPTIVSCRLIHLSQYALVNCEGAMHILTILNDMSKEDLVL